MNVKKLLLAFVAMVALAPAAWADDSSTTIASSKEYTIDEVVSAGDFVFSLVNDDGEVLYTPSGSNQYALIDKGSLPDAYNSVGLKLDKTSDGQYTIQCYNQDLSGQLDNWYFQSQPTNGTVLFGWYGFANHTYGTDGDNLGLWEFKLADGGYKLYDVGTQLYLKDGAPAKYSADEAAVWHIYRTIDILAENYTVTLNNIASSLETAAKSKYETDIQVYNASVANTTTYSTYVKGAEAVLAAATKTQTGLNSDWTGVIANSHFRTTDVSAWTITGTAPTVDVSYHNCEYYQKDFDMKQVISGMKKGTYEISLQAFQRPGWAGTEMFQNEKDGKSTSLATLYTTAQSADVPNIYAYAQTASRNTNNEMSTELDGTTYYIPNGMYSAQVYFDEGLYTVSAKAVVTEENGDLSFGFKGNLSSTGGAWLIFDNFTLKYISEDVLVDEAESQKLLTQYEALGQYNTELKTKVDAAATALKADLTSGSLYAAFSELLNQAQTSDKAYAVAAAELEYVNSLLDNTNVYTEETHTALVNEVKDVQTKYDAGTLTNDEANAVSFMDKAAKMVNSTWTRNNTEYEFVVNTWSVEGNNDGSEFKVPFVQYWRWWDSLADATLTSTMTDLPEGKYKVTMDLRLQKANGADVDAALSGVSVSVNNGESVAFSTDDAAYYATSGLYVEPIEAYGSVLDGKLLTQINVESTTASWVSFRNVKYERVGDVDYSSAYNTALANAKSLTGKTMQSAVLEGLNNAISENGSLGESPSSNEYKAAILALNEAIDLAKQSIAVTATGAGDILAKMRELTESTNVYSDEALATYYTNPWAAFQDGSMTLAEAQSLQNPYADKGKSSNVAKFLSSVWNFGDLEDLNYHVNTWSTEGNNDGSNFLTPFIEYWVNDDKSLDEKTLTATVPNLKASTKYLVTSWTRVRLTNNSSNPTCITLQVGDGEEVDVCTGTQVGTSQLYLGTFTAVGSTDESGNLTIKYNVGSGNNISWLSFQKMNYAEVPEAETRGIAENLLGTISLPYAFTAKDADLYEVAEVADGVVKLKQVEEGVAGAAYIYQATAAEQSFSYASGSLVSEPTAGTLTGVFEATKATPDTYVLQKQGDVQKFYRVVAGSEPTIGAYRAYLTVPETESSAETAASYRISLGGTTTGIEAVEALTNGKAEIYDLNGRKLNKLQKGVNIVNGVKVYVK